MFLLAIGATLAFGASSAFATDVLTQNWESGLGGWTVTGDTAPGWHVQANPQTISVKSPDINPTLVTLPDSGQLPAAFDGTNVAWFGDPASGTFCGNYTLVAQTPKNGCESDRAYQGTLESPSFSLVGASSAIVHFEAWWEIESVNADAYDLMQVEYSTDGGANWHPAGKLNPADNPAGNHDQSYSNNGLETTPSWKEYLVDISPAVGSSTVKIRFNFDTRDQLYQGFRGWMVDAIRVATPYDAAAPSISSVEACSGGQSAPVTVIHGSNFVLGSSVILDGSEMTGVSTPSSDRIEIPAVDNGSHTVQVKSPNGTLSNTVSFTAGGCLHPSATAVSCNYIFATLSDTCTAQVGDAGAPPRTTPTGKVTFSSNGGGVFSAGNTCNLTPTPSSPGVASCSVQFLPPAKGTPTIGASYSGDTAHGPSSGATSFLIAALPPDLASGLTDSPSSFLAAPSGPSFSPAFVASVAKKKYGTTVHFRLKAPALMKFTVERLAPGRKVKNGKKVTCKAPNKKNQKHAKCTRFVTVKGSFTITGKAGVNTFKFLGRIGGKKLKPGTYVLVGTPSIAGVKGKNVTVRFKIKKP